MPRTESRRERRFWIALVLTLLGSALLERGVSRAVEPRLLPEATVAFQIRRFADLLSNLDSILSSGKDVAFLMGSSEVEAYLNPRIMERAFADRNVHLDAYNLGVRVLHPWVFEVFAARMAEEMGRRNRRSRLTVVQLPQVFMTDKSEETMAGWRFRGVVRFLSSPKMLWSRILQDPAAGLHRALSKFVAGSSQPGAITGLLRSGLLKHAIRQDRSGYGAFFGIWQDPVFMEFPAWSLSDKGLYRFNLPSSSMEFEDYSRLRSTPEARKWSVQYFEDCCALADIRFSNPSLRSVLRGLQQIRKFSEMTLVVFGPEAPEILARRGPDANGRIERALNWISRRSGLPLINYSQGNRFDAADFEDVIHLSPAGQEKFFRHLAQDIGPHISKPR